MKKSTIGYEVIVVDNHSTDGSLAMVARKYPNVLLMKNKENVGYGRANNQAIRVSHGQYILLLNSDIAVKDHAIETLYRNIQANPKCFIGGKLMNEDGSAQPSCGPFYSLPIVFLMLFMKGDYWGATRSSPKTKKIVDWVSGACIMGKKEWFENVGLFDEKIFLYMEEIDFFYRAHRKGYTTLFLPNATFIHSGAASSNGHQTPVVNIYRGLVYFYKKHYHPLSGMCLRFLLRLKAIAVISLATIIHKKQLVQIYEESLRVV